jgi:hypothetical protein
MNNDQFCFVSSKITEDKFDIGYFCHFKIGENDSAWFFLAGSEGESVFDNAENFREERLSDVILYQPFVRPYISHPPGSEFQYDRVNDRVIDYTKKRTFTSAGKVAFPHACDVPPSILSWLRFDPLALFFILIVPVSVVAALFHHPAWFVATAAFGLRPAASWIAFYEHFKYGEALAGIVVSTTPPLIAVEYCHGSDSDQKRFIQIYKLRPKTLHGGRVKLGDRIVLASVPKSETAWNLKKNIRLNALPVNRATSDFRKIEAAFSKITPQEWESLEEGISQLELRIKPGKFEIQFNQLADSDVIGETPAVY